MDREKEIRHEIYKKSEEIKQLKKEIIALHAEFDMIYGYKKLERAKTKQLGGKKYEKTK